MCYGETCLVGDEGFADCLVGWIGGTVFTGPFVGLDAVALDMAWNVQN